MVPFALRLAQHSNSKLFLFQRGIEKEKIRPLYYIFAEEAKRQKVVSTKGIGYLTNATGYFRVLRPVGCASASFFLMAGRDNNK